ncbi:CPX chromosomal region candidate gene 1 protein [Phodopus roborovskii]|uniref:CPX chromosomal region candidate gene 1 protein n=1 Tax=Phodopus roborovskii TaxID=109678 RepID=UPI0021E4F6BC|nr:CPX chromosomal region candidate gene 1 protein [Phodopus roborovskii]
MSSTNRGSGPAENAVKNAEIEAPNGSEKTQTDPSNEVVIEDSLPLQKPIPRKLIFHKPLSDKIKFYQGKKEMRINDYFLSSIHDKMLHSHFLWWQVPFTNIDEINRMFIHLMCGRYFSPPLRVYYYHPVLERMTPRKTIIIAYNNNWKYLCPICGCDFNNFQDFKHHSCNFSGN